MIVPKGFDVYVSELCFINTLWNEEKTNVEDMSGWVKIEGSELIVEDEGYRVKDLFKLDGIGGRWNHFYIASFIITNEGETPLFYIAWFTYDQNRRKGFTFGTYKYDDIGADNQVASFINSVKLAKGTMLYLYTDADSTQKHWKYSTGISGPNTVYFNNINFMTFEITAFAGQKARFWWTTYEKEQTYSDETGFPEGRYDCGDLGDWERYKGFEIAEDTEVVFYYDCFDAGTDRVATTILGPRKGLDFIEFASWNVKTFKAVWIKRAEGMRALQTFTLSKEYTQEWADGMVTKIDADPAFEHPYGLDPRYWVYGLVHPCREFGAFNDYDIVVIPSDLEVAFFEKIEDCKDGDE
jgi:hypothetical protein